MKRPLLLFALFAALLLIVLQVGAWLAAGDGDAFDRTILGAARIAGVPIGPHWLIPGAIDLTTLGGAKVLIPLTLLVAALLLARGRHRDALLLLVGTLSGRLVVSLLKDGIARPRPPIAGHLVEVTSFSFPSGHAANSALVYLLFATMLTRTGHKRGAALTAAILLTLLIGASRVYLGVHWPSDVTAGWMFGALWAMLWQGLADRRSQR